MCAAKWNETDRSTVRTIKTMMIGKPAAKGNERKKKKKLHRKCNSIYFFLLFCLVFVLLCVCSNINAEIYLIFCSSIAAVSVLSVLARACVCVCANICYMWRAGAQQYIGRHSEMIHNNQHSSEVILFCVALEKAFTPFAWAHHRLQLFAQTHWWYVSATSGAYSNKSHPTHIRFYI